ncbi:doubled CXXCH domain-containing protein [Selenihalanaerobacter shriftii]|uniref:Doubled CXXCH domain-containing protein n=2 Tax=Selenihalanaerobacter shriftii TaxID=142842 RepID=A0A1T4LVB5_9FIRM|nr:doubled CXXCH domain-containing protein [Selenihalanaerobacter shriftii]
MLSLMFFLNSVAAARTDKYCLTCHGLKGFTTEHNDKEISLTVNQSILKDSVHNNNNCVTCHMDIQGYPHKNVVYGTELAVKVANNCQMCHSNEAKGYKESRHWEVTKEGKTDVSCSSCHGKHDIQKSDFTKQEELELCSECHKGIVLESTKESFHGKAVELGSKRAASCVDCHHDSHRILGPQHQESSVSDKNLPKTCAKCHEKPRKNFAKGVQHAELEPEGEGAPMYYTFKFFTWLTILTITFLIVHILIELIGKFRRANNDESH